MFQIDHLSIAVDALCIEKRATRASDWNGLAAAENNSGLYTWWVDREGAEALAGGLGVSLSRGLIYGGQAGATRWPSGTKSEQTLSGRIQSNHLSGTIRSSTFRRTLAAALVSELGLRVVPGRKAGLARQSEAELSKWMRSHLSLLVWPFADRDNLEQLEGKVLSRLDPPMNLRGMRSTPLRSAIRLARKNLSDASPSQVPVVDKINAKPSTKRGARSVTLHEEISEILISNGNRWMSTKEIAFWVNERGLYKKRDRSDVTGFQVHGRTRNYSKLFERDGQLVRLIRS
ncbi:hypothetical protein RUE5091_00122 [Ruegeria denitrificans]|uniref:GIY-YIG catalytic domain-containing protein n=1 Tax=Ruegeria denitrificans TaxID=1715692 RepID=A0A0P1I0U0_9RHOB|nr:hypothetical protein [Ruegeria denitrificans]CUJ83535.1 hypothetical protein RUE5091_00122 [Ruegeria denitrificans]